MAISYYCEREKNSSYLFNGRFFDLTGEYFVAAVEKSFVIVRGKILTCKGGMLS